MVSPTFPIFLPRIAAFWLIERDLNAPSELDAELVVRLDTEELHKGPVHMAFENKVLSWTIAIFNGFLIPHPGILSVSLEMSGQTIGTYQVPIEQVESTLQQK